MKRLFTLFTFLAFVANVAVGSPEPGSAETARNTIEEWVQTQQLLSKERADWRQEKQTLQQSIGLLEEEIAVLTSRLRELDDEESETAAKGRSTQEENDRLLAASKEAENLVADLEKELQALRPYLPAPLKREAAQLFSRLDEAEERSVALSQRLQTVLGLLAEVNRFQRNVTLTRETRELEDGTRREVRTLYLGLAQAYFVDDQVRIAGTGRPKADGWEWVRDDEISGSVDRAVAILEKERPAAFVNLPVEVER